MSVTWDCAPVMDIGSLHHLVSQACDEIVQHGAFKDFIKARTVVSNESGLCWTSFELAECGSTKFWHWTLPFGPEFRLVRWFYYHPRVTHIFGCQEISLEIYYPALIPICEQVAHHMVLRAPIELTIRLSSL
jgi:hypothetical protein